MCEISFFVFVFTFCPLAIAWRCLLSVSRMVCRYLALWTKDSLTAERMIGGTSTFALLDISSPVIACTNEAPVECVVECRVYVCVCVCMCVYVYEIRIL